MKNIERQTYTGDTSAQGFTNGEIARSSTHVPPFEIGAGGRLIFRGKSWEAKTGKVVKGTGRHGRDRNKR